MAKKDLDLSDYSIQHNTSTQTKGKYSVFLENEESNSTLQEPQTTDKALETSEEPDTKESRVNMAFPDTNYEFILSETSRLNVNFMYFLNHIISSTSNEDIDAFMDNNPLFKGGRSSAPRRRGHRMKRINFKISTENHQKLNTCASKNDATITAIVNAILEIYIAKNNININ